MLTYSVIGRTTSQLVPSYFSAHGTVPQSYPLIIIPVLLYVLGAQQRRGYSENNLELNHMDVDMLRASQCCLHFGESRYVAGSITRLIETENN